MLKNGWPYLAFKEKAISWQNDSVYIIVIFQVSN